MNLLTVSNQCNDPIMLYILGICKTFLNIIWIVGPIVALIGLVLILVKLVINPEEKKYKKSITNWLIAFVMLALIPMLINIVMGLMDGAFKLGSCWASAMIIFNI